MPGTRTDRKYGEDSVYFNKQRGCWVAQYNTVIEGEPIRKSASGQTEKEALQKLESIKRNLMKNVATRKRKAKLTFGDAMDKMMRALKGTVEDKTYSDYEYRMALLKTYPIARKRLDLIDIPFVQETINSIVHDRGLCESTCGKLIMFIKRTFRFALECRDIAYNPVSEKKCIKIPVAASEAEDVKPLSKPDLDALLAVLEGTPRIKPIVYCMLLAGLRIGEALALTWDKIDFDDGQHGTLLVDKSVKKYKVKKGEGTKSEYRLGPPKTKSSVRKLAMTKQLREHLLTWQQLQKFHAPDKTGQNLVFPKRNGKLQDYDSFNIGFNKYLKKVGLDYHLYHSRVFRHTFASYLVKQGASHKALQRLMGHAKIETTLQYYVDTDQDTLDEAVQKIDIAIIDPKFTFLNLPDSKNTNGILHLVDMDFEKPA